MKSQRMLAVVAVGVILALLAAWFRPAAADEGDTEALAAALRKVMDENLAACAREDLEGVLNTIHSKSQAYQTARPMHQGLFTAYDLKYKITSFRYIGTDGDCAVVRLAQETRKVAGPDFKDNTVDGVHVLQKENGEWKISGSVILSVQWLQQDSKPESPQPAQAP